MNDPGGASEPSGVRQSRRLEGRGEAQTKSRMFALLWLPP